MGDKGQPWQNPTLTGNESDTGSQMSLVKHILVLVGSVDYSRRVDILYVHGDKHPYSKAALIVTIDETPYFLTVVDKLIVYCILGVDLPVVMSLLQEEELDSGEKVEVSVNICCPVIT